MRDVEPGADEELALAFLGHAQLVGVFDLAMHTVAERTGLFLHAGEILAARRHADAQHIFHHEYFGLEMLHVAQQFPVEVPPVVVNHPRAAVGAVPLADLAEALAGRAADNHIHTLGAEQRFEVLRMETGQVFFEDVSDFGEIGPVGGNRVRVGIVAARQRKPARAMPRLNPPHPQNRSR